MQYFGFDRPSFGIKTYGFGSSEFSPLDLFAGGKQGVWYDPSDKSTLFQDVAGTVPVTKDGDPVALMRDKSGNNNHATQSVSTARPIYKTDGILHWYEGDGVDDELWSSNQLPIKNNAMIAAAWRTGAAIAAMALMVGLESGAVYNRMSINSRQSRLNYVARESASRATGEISCPVNQQHVAVATINSSNQMRVTLDGVSSTNDSTAALLTGSTSGRISALTANGTTSRVYGFIYVDGVSDIGFANAASQYLATKAGVTL